MPGFVEKQNVDPGKAAVNDLQQLVRIQIGQTAVEQQQLALAVFQLAQSIGAAQRLRRRNARQHQALHDLLAKPGIRASYDYCRIIAAEGLYWGCHIHLVPRKPWTKIRRRLEFSQKLKNFV